MVGAPGGPVTPVGLVQPGAPTPEPEACPWLPCPFLGLGTLAEKQKGSSRPATAPGKVRGVGPLPREAPVRREPRAGGPFLLAPRTECSPLTRQPCTQGRASTNGQPGTAPSCPTE